MPWKESEAASEGNGPVRQEEIGFGQPALADIDREIWSLSKQQQRRLDNMMRRLDQLSEQMKMDQHLARQEQDARQSRLAMEEDGQASQLSEQMKMDQHLARQEQDARQSRLAMEADGQASQLSEEMKMDQHLACLEQDARQSRLAMEADGQASTKTRERTEGAATAAQATRGDSFSAGWVEPGPKAKSTSFGMETEPPAFPFRDGAVVVGGDAAPKSCLPSLEMHPSTAADGLVPTGEAYTATRTTSNEPLLRFYATEEMNPENDSKEINREEDSKEKKTWTSVPPAWYDNSFWKLLPAPSGLRVIETKPMENRTIDPGGSQGHLRACPFLGPWRVLVCGEAVRDGDSWGRAATFFSQIRCASLKQDQLYTVPPRVARGYTNKSDE